MVERGFQLWIRVRREGRARYDLRFEARGSRGQLRVVRPGIPAAQRPAERGEARELTAAQLRASRFVHLWEGAHRRLYSLAELDERRLGELDEGAWVAVLGAEPAAPRPAPVASLRGAGIATVPLASSSDTVLVRMLRRQAVDDAVQIRELQARVAALAAELEALKGARD